MIKRIEITNFMSHAHTVIEPADGLTVIVGDNNTGKSALISALQVLCRNAPGDYMLRHGARECSVRVLTDDGHEIEWIRRKKVVSYRINGREVHRLGGSVPDDLHELLRLPLVETETDPFDIHFGEQKKPIFLLNESSSRRATFFASSSDTIKLIEMQGRHRRKIQEARAAEAGLVRREAALKQRRDTLAPVDRLEPELEYLEAEYEQILFDASGIRTLEQDIRKLETAVSGARQWAASVEAVQDLEPPPRLEDVAALQRLGSQIAGRTGDIERETGRISAAGSLSPPPGLADTRPVAEMIRKIGLLAGRADTCRALQAVTDRLAPPPLFEQTSDLSQLIGKAEQLMKRCGILDAKAGLLGPLGEPPAIADIQPLQRLIGILSAARSGLSAAEAVQACLGRLPVPPEIADVSGLASRIERAASVLNSCDRLEAGLLDIRAEQEAATAALTACIEATGVCPTCGHDLDPEGFIERMPLAGEGRR